MHRNRLILFLVIGLSIFMSLPLLNMASRVRTHAGPVIPDDLEQLWSADLAEGAIALALWFCCDLSLQPDNTLIGESGYLFLGNSHDAVIDKTIGRFQPTQEKIDAWTKSLQDLSKYVESTDGSFVFVLAPNKHSIYPNYLPQSVVPAVETVTDRVVESAQRHGLPVIDLRKPLRDLQSEAQAYLLTDTHWTQAGAALAYTQTMTFLNEKTNLDLYPLYFKQTELYRSSGDLAAFLKVGPLLSVNHEKDYTLEYDVNSFCVGKLHLNADTADPCKAQKDLSVSARPNDAFFRKSHVDGAPNEETVVMICDSFCRAHSGLFNASFQTVYRIHWFQLEGEILKDSLARLQPDIVIFQLVERNLLAPVLTFN